MQAFEGYLEDGRFFPLGTQACFKGRRKVIVTLLDEELGDEKHQAEIKLLSELMKSEKTAKEKGWLSEAAADALIERL